MKRSVFLVLLQDRQVDDLIWCHYVMVLHQHHKVEHRLEQELHPGPVEVTTTEPAPSLHPLEIFFNRR